MKRCLDLILVWIPAAFLVISLAWVAAYRWMPVRWTPLMLKRSLEYTGESGYSNRQIWVKSGQVSPVMVQAILLSEDQRFYSHNGFDAIELRKMKEEHDRYGNRLRGCSTISQQVAKNCFTFGSRTMIRKAVEAYYTVLMELLWGKERILEVYLNVVETGKGLFGVEAACQEYFMCTAGDLYLDDAVALACVLPKPLARTPISVRTTHYPKVNKLTKDVLNLIAETPLNKELYEK